MKAIERNPAADATVNDLAGMVARIRGTDEKTLGCSAAMMVVLWTDGSLSYGGLVGAPSSTLALAAALQLQANHAMNEVKERMDEINQQRIIAQIEAQQRAQAGVASN
jgi:hypothetical protein